MEREAGQRSKTNVLVVFDYVTAVACDVIGKQHGSLGEWVLRWSSFAAFKARFWTDGSGRKSYEFNYGASDWSGTRTVDDGPWSTDVADLAAQTERYAIHDGSGKLACGSAKDDVATLRAIPVRAAGVANVGEEVAWTEVSGVLGGGG